MVSPTPNHGPQNKDTFLTVSTVLMHRMVAWQQLWNHLPLPISHHVPISNEEIEIKDKKCHYRENKVIFLFE